MSNDLMSRTCFYYDVGGAIRFYDWAISNYAGKGTCHEPFFVNQIVPHIPGGNAALGTGREQLDYTETTKRITYLIPTDFDRMIVTVFGDGTRQLHGGYMYPRTGR